MRRGQAALEFLTTYGWAFLVILVMIGAISYFGILNPGKLLPARCTTSGEFTCEDYMITSQFNGVLKVQLKQTTGKTIFLNNFTCYHGEEAQALANDEDGITNNANPPISWSAKNAYQFNCEFPTGSEVADLAGQKIKVYFIINYQKSATGTLNHVATGEVYATVQ